MHFLAWVSAELCEPIDRRMAIYSMSHNFVWNFATDFTARALKTNVANAYASSMLLLLLRSCCFYTPAASMPPLLMNNALMLRERN